VTTMAETWRRSGGWLLVLTRLLSVGCSSKPDLVRPVTPREAHELVSGGQAVLVDVREQSEVRNGIAEGARWFATTKVSEAAAWDGFVASLPRDKEILFYCGKGGRAAKAAQKLAEAGFRTGNVGGFKDWMDAGLPWQRPVQLQ
jgi:rhodanese-related sulfurtransferase